MRKVLCVLSFLLASALPALADSTPHWLEVKTDHFTVLTDGSERQARHTAGELERMHAVYAKLLPNASDDPGSRIVVLAFHDRKGFQTVEPAAYLTKNALELAGLFLRGEDRNYILLRLDSSGDHPYATVYHEYTHYMVRHADYLPVWLNEGLAQFYQNTDIMDHDVRLGQPDPNQLEFLRQQRLLPLETLFLVDHNSPYYHEENKGNIFYAESWALTHYLFLADFGRSETRLHAYTVYLAQGEGPLAAAQHAFGDLKQLQTQLNGYINHGEYKALTMPLKNAVDEKDLQVQPLAEPDADAVRADVLARDGRMEDAKNLLGTVLAEAPQNAEAHESMGLLKLREGDMEGARKWYGEAVALHSTSFLAYYYYGTLSMRQGPSAAESAADSLREAIKLNPHFAPALESLAQFDAMHHEKLDEALEMGLRAVVLDPRNLEYRLNASEVRVERKEYPSAVSGLQATLKMARTTEERARVQARLDQIQTFQGQQKQAESLHAEGAREMAEAAETPRPSGPSAITDKSGRVLHPVVYADPDHPLPDGPATGAKHTVTGTLASVACFYPKGLTFKVMDGGKPITLYAKDMYAITYTAGNFESNKTLNPCSDFQGMKAKITYAGVEDPYVAGQIVAMELSR